MFVFFVVREVSLFWKWMRKVFGKRTSGYVMTSHPNKISEVFFEPSFKVYYNRLFVFRLNFFNTELH